MKKTNAQQIESNNAEWRWDQQSVFNFFIFLLVPSLAAWRIEVANNGIHNPDTVIGFQNGFHLCNDFANDYIPEMKIDKLHLYANNIEFVNILYSWWIVSLKWK